MSVAVVLPHSMFKQREYKKIIGQSALKLHGSNFEKMFDLSPYLEMMQPIPAPTEVLGKICDQVRILICDFTSIFFSVLFIFMGANISSLKSNLENILNCISP